ncbi:Regulator of G-protein signaling 21 [Nibea albiflora]|uniref:Regulator of G-protein signaling 21 n=1 Tax=Nibea albiflora TaxID=240163 RepID=A0ACB7ER99_NIBAL|nr:Regulator of G-protein signaling 21 [Nibea albiflora]
MPKHLFSKIRFYEIKDLMQNVKRPRRIDIVLNRKRHKKDIQCLMVQKINDEAHPSKLSWQTNHKVHQTLEKLLRDKSESGENIEFWLACEDFKSTASPDDLCWKAEEIYQEFIQPTACREINVDHHIKEEIKKSLEKPSLSCFDEAQKQVYLLMERDSCPRFLHSDAYLSLKNKSKSLCEVGGEEEQEEEEEEGVLPLQSGLMHPSSPDGLATFRSFLKSEYSDENIEFWLTCEDYKKIKSSFRMSSRAKKIYEQFIKAESPKEINIDYHTREQIKRNVKTPTMHCFDDAQKIVYGLMERDSYPRFLRSDIYRTLLENLAADATKG